VNIERNEQERCESAGIERMFRAGDGQPHIRGRSTPMIALVCQQVGESWQAA
jgi:hypothetical protein